MTTVEEDPWANLRTRPIEDPQARRYQAMKAYQGKSIEANRRKEHFIELIGTGSTIDEALAEVGVGRNAYKQWRSRDRSFAARVDVARAGKNVLRGEYSGGHAEFAERYFGMSYAWFQLVFIQELEKR